MNGTKKDFNQTEHAGLALDPIHVGSGSTRLGRVDNTIVRDPSTRLPLIPGSSLAGVTRAYAAMSKKRYPQCAGQGDSAQGTCGKKDCPICTVFGFAVAGGTSTGFAGLAAFSDMQLLLFPVPSQKGPRWITSPSALGILDAEALRDDTAYCLESEEKPGEKSGVRLGWLYLKKEVLKTAWDEATKMKLENLRIPQTIRKRTLVLTDRLLAPLVNSNLEVRTSVSIDPQTGCAREGALFTYEALPRGSVLVWTVTRKNPEHF